MSRSQVWLGVVVCGVVVACSPGDEGDGASVSVSSSPGVAVRTPVITGSEGTATVSASDSPLTKWDLFDPCTIPESVLLEFGMHPQPSGDSGFTGFRTCDWSARDDQLFFLAAVDASTRSFEEIRAATQLDNMRETMVGDRRAVMFTSGRVDGDPARPQRCGVAWGTSTGSITVWIESRPASRNPGRPTWSDPCVHVQQWADLVFPVAPR